MQKYSKVATFATLTAILALAVISVVDSTVVRAATCGNSVNCAKTLAPGDPASSSPGGPSTSQIAPGHNDHQDDAPGQVKSP